MFAMCHLENNNEDENNKGAAHYLYVDRLGQDLEDHRNHVFVRDGWG